MALFLLPHSLCSLFHSDRTLRPLCHCRSGFPYSFLLCLLFCLVPMSILCFCLALVFNLPFFCFNTVCFSRSSFTLFVIFATCYSFSFFVISSLIIPSRIIFVILVATLFIIPSLILSFLLYLLRHFGFLLRHFGFLLRHFGFLLRHFGFLLRHFGFFLSFPLFLCHSREGGNQEIKT